MKKEYNSMYKPTFDDVMKLDQSLQYLAAYEVTGGKMIVPASAEAFAELNVKIAQKFNYFKGLIHSGECTLDFIKFQVLSKNGPYRQDKSDIDIAGEEFKKQNEEWGKDPIDIKAYWASNGDPILVQKLIRALFPSADIEDLKQTEQVNEDGAWTKETTIQLTPKDLPETHKSNTKKTGNKNKKRKKQ